MDKGFPLLLVNLLATWFLAGLIWMVQLVHYPLFARVGAPEWQAFHTEHMRMITVIIAPMMFIEALSAAALVFVAREYPPQARLCVWIAAALVLSNWLVTAGVAVPLHNRLGEGLDVAVVDRLVAVNWLRTAGWTLRGLLLAFVTWKVVQAIPRASSASGPLSA
ncbi:MAG: hypothetical protein NZ561_12040 [Phycisphaerae bacterium]|nr:hypothetical protein [Phycisphaerae bacterium]MDW8262957.1 hypothetical protein [Phycisphaerales bacterium]